MHGSAAQPPRFPAQAAVAAPAPLSRASCGTNGAVSPQPGPAAAADGAIPTGQPTPNPT